MLSPFQQANRQEHSSVSMSIPLRGSRRIVVGGNAYRWYLRRKPSYNQAVGETGLSVAVQAVEPVKRGVLIIDVNAPHPGNWLNLSTPEVSPRDIALWITEARLSGWKPNTGGRFHLAAAHRPAHMPKRLVGDRHAL